jgi:hypothetical protein
MFVDELANALGIVNKEDWNELRSSMIRKRKGGNSMFRFFDWSPTKLLKDMFPNHQWDEWKFVQTPQSWWTNWTNAVRFMEALRQQEGWSSLDDLYNISAATLRKHGGSSPISS